MGDPVLIKMQQAVSSFETAMRRKSRPHWLTLWGSPGTGKTFLARQIHAMHPGRAHWMCWTKLCRRFQSREDTASAIAFACDARLLCLDDIGAEHQTPATVGLLHGLLQARMGRWTLITSNHSPAVWQAVDSRISSRLIRGENRHACCDTLHFAMRPKPNQKP